MIQEHNHKTKANSNPYTVEDAIKVADDIFKLSKDKKYNLGAFIHGLIFAQEYAQHSFKIPQQQIAIIKRDCRKYFKAIDIKKR
ncbi:MAG: hypothetical protein JSU91_07030 [Thermoplasmatales archaeon]|nr:MAG: hypothetical protein JSU91_07030 [Thermoplasmatales archaeon]